MHSSHNLSGGLAMPQRDMDILVNTMKLEYTNDIFKSFPLKYNSRFLRNLFLRAKLTRPGDKPLPGPIEIQFIHYDDVIMTMLASQITSLTVVYSIVYSGVNQRKHQSSASLAFVREIHRGPLNFPHKWPVTRKMFPFDDVIIIMPLWVECLWYTDLNSICFRYCYAPQLVEFCHRGCSSTWRQRRWRWWTRWYPRSATGNSRLQKLSSE